MKRFDEIADFNDCTIDALLPSYPLHPNAGVGSVSQPHHPSTTRTKDVIDSISSHSDMSMQYRARSRGCLIAAARGHDLNRTYKSPGVTRTN
jgi:hypothetical protein